MEKMPYLESLDTDFVQTRSQQCLRINQVTRVEAFGEPGVERGEEGAGRVRLR